MFHLNLFCSSESVPVFLVRIGSSKMSEQSRFMNPINAGVYYRNIIEILDPPKPEKQTI